MKQARSRVWERGTTILTVLILVIIISVAIVNHVLLAGYASVASLQARNQFAARQAATACIAGDVPDSTGGSLFPDAAVEGWSDTVCIDPESGQIVACDGVEGAAVSRVLRQWRVGVDRNGGRVFEVTAAVVDEHGARRSARQDAFVSLSRRIP